MKVLKTSSDEFTIVCAVKGFDKVEKHGLKAERSEKIDITIDATTFVNRNFWETKNNLEPHIKQAMKTILLRTGSTTYATFTLYDADMNALSRYACFPLQNKYQYAVWENDEWRWSKVYEACSGRGASIEEIVETLILEPYHIFFDEICERYFEVDWKG